MSESKNLLLAAILSFAILFGWQYFYERPRLEQAQRIAALKQKETATQKPAVAPLPPMTRQEAVNQGGRVHISTAQLHGSITLKGLRFDDLTLANYHTSIDKDSPEVSLLSPSNTTDAYFAEFGWLATDNTIIVPDASSVWTADKNTLHAGETVTLTWESPQGLRFTSAISLDEHYMFSVAQSVTNSSGQNVTLLPYGLLNRNWHADHHPFYILHEGPIGVINNILTEEKYADLKERHNKEFDESANGWVGITDKYWLTALVPDKSLVFKTNFSHSQKGEHDKFQVDYLGKGRAIAPGEKISLEHHFFAGAKKVSLLDHYADTLNIPLFDRAVDFGWFYFLTKPMFKALQFFHSHVGNFGIAIMLLTVFVKLLMFPLANKSYSSMSKMKALQPELLKIRERFEDDKVQLNKEVMELYKREKVNPVSGCLPMLVQIPVFFSLYKVLFVTIEMRHAPFFGWIHDLSAPDPTSIFNLFGLIPWQPPAFLMIGALPLIMGVTMVLQQRLNPEPSDPVQAKVMKFLPVFFIFMFHSFPAGLILYWAWNNTLSFLQQWVITRDVRTEKKAKA